jgi:acetyl-CoA C-acetyltransferase
MRSVAIIGIGQTKIDEQWDKSIQQIAVEAIRAALLDAGRESAEALFLGNMMAGIINSQNNLALLVADWAGLKIPAIKLDAACGSGGATLRSGLMAVASGELDSAPWWGWKK